MQHREKFTAAALSYFMELFHLSLVSPLVIGKFQ